MTRVAIVEDQREIREGLKALISGTPDYSCAGAWRSMEEALEQIARDVPDAVLVDIGLPGMPGTEGIRLLKQRYPSLPALVLTVYEDDERIFDALCAGACGYLLKSTPPARLLEMPAGSRRRRRAHVAAGGPAGGRVVPRLSPAGKIRSRANPARSAAPGSAGGRP